MFTTQMMNFLLTFKSEDAVLTSMIVSLEDLRTDLLIRPVLFVGPGVVHPKLAALDGKNDGLHIKLVLELLKLVVDGPRGVGIPAQSQRHYGNNQGNDGHS